MPTYRLFGGMIGPFVNMLQDYSCYYNPAIYLKMQTREQECSPYLSLATPVSTFTSRDPVRAIVNLPYPEHVLTEMDRLPIRCSCSLNVGPRTIHSSLLRSSSL